MTNLLSFIFRLSMEQTDFKVQRSLNEYIIIFILDHIGGLTDDTKPCVDDGILLQQVRLLSVDPLKLYTETKHNFNTSIKPKTVLIYTPDVFFLTC